MLLPVTEKRPRYITIGAHYRCNADCRFCLGGDYPDFTLRCYREFFEKELLPVMRDAEHVGFCGYGEVLLMPGITGFLDYINTESLSGTVKVFTTNGYPLDSEIRERLVGGRYSIIISLHASNSKLHEMLTGRKMYEQIINNIETLAGLKKKRESSLHINLAFLLTTLNIGDLPDFVELSARLGADRVTCSYLTVFSRNQLPMSCFFHQDETLRSMEKAAKAAERSGLELILPPRFGNKEDEPRICRDPWEFFYVEVQRSVLPCCYAGDHIGYLGESSFEEIWNSPGYIRLRKGLLSGDPYRWCSHCMNYRSSNVNDIRSHITFRHGVREELLEYMESAGYDNIKNEFKP